MSSALPGLALGRFTRLARKELAEILRDRRTVLTLLLMPLLLYPILSVAFRQFLLSGVVGSEVPHYRLGFESEDDANAAFRFLKRGEESLARRGAFRGEENALSDAMVRPIWEAFSASDLEKEIGRGELTVGMRLVPTGQLREDPRGNLAVDIQLIYREDSAPGLDFTRYLERLCREENANFLSRRLALVGIKQRADPVQPQVVALPNPEGRRSRIFAVLVPLILILMTITGAVYPAIDLTAGERERGTLEVLIAAPVPRWALLGAKYVAVVTVAILTALVNLGSMALTLWASGLGKALLGDEGLSLWLLPQMFGLLLLLAAFFSGVLLALTSFARSFKEAQAYLIPLMLASLLPGTIGLVPGLRLEGPLAVAPLINIVLLGRDILEGVANPVAAAVVVLSTALYAAAAIAVAARTFGAEAVLYAQEGGWGEWLRRPPTSWAAASASGALLCLALMFPASFVLNRLIAELREEPVAVLLAAQGIATVGLFGGFPLAAAWQGRVRATSGLRLVVPGVGACLAALLLGLCLWPLAQELGLLLRWLGIATLSETQMSAAKELLVMLRSAPVPVVLFVLGILIPVMEEFFFRGYLFSALLAASRPRTAILTSALLFGLFHLITGAGIAVERLITTSLLGVILGWLCWKSGSVVPGMLLHATHNSVITLLALHEPWLQAQGWAMGESDHLPAGVLLGAIAGSLLGGVWVWLIPAPENPVDPANEE
jgi:sodium transport system permease protein